MGKKVDWHKRYFELAGFIAGWSKDKNAGIGAIIVDDEKRIVSTGYNGFPSGCDDSVEERYERPLKYTWTEHAERNAIYSAAKNGVQLKGTTMYIQWFPCSDCARAIIQTGIKTLYCTEPTYDHPKYGADFKISKEMLEECGIKLNFIEK